MLQNCVIIMKKHQNFMKMFPPLLLSIILIYTKTKLNSAQLYSNGIRRITIANIFYLYLIFMLKIVC